MSTEEDSNTSKQLISSNKRHRDQTEEEKKNSWRKVRAERRCRKKQRYEEKRTAEQAVWATLTDDEKAEIKANALKLHTDRIAQHEAHKQQCINNISDQSLPSLVFDLSHWNQMNERGKKSSIMQVKYSYSLLKKSGFLMRPVLTSLAPKVAGGELLQQLVDYEGFKVFPPQTTDAHWKDILDKDKVIYLSADSDNVLRTIDPGYYYIIGAFVDHNMKKGLTESTAKELGVKTMRLPISETISVGNLCKVLTINHVTEVLKVFMETSCWKKAFEMLPTRRQSQRSKSGSYDDQDELGRVSGL